MAAMVTFWLTAIIGLTLWCEVLLGQASNPNYYTAAVFEHTRLGNSSVDLPADIIRMNLNVYKKAADLAKIKGADIILFPEYGIFPPQTREILKNYLEHTPDPKTTSSNPCEEPDKFADKPILFTLSCMAKNNSIIVVANTGDIQPCHKEEDTKCPDDGVYHLNTEVAFDRNGTLIAKYYKEYLFYELGMDLPTEPQDAIFHTDIGTFAMFICFDSIMNNSVVAAQKPEVDTILFSVMWLDPMPFMNSVQYWQAWALGNKITTLASNINIPGYNSVGSGIFSGHMGALLYSFNPDGLSKLIVSRAPKSRHQNLPFPNPDTSITVVTSDGIRFYNKSEDGKDVPDECSFELLGKAKNIYKNYTCFPEITTNYTFVKLTSNSGYLDVCNNGMCCSLNYSAESMNEDYYFGVYNGSYNMLKHYFWCQENCLLARCDSFDGAVCRTFPLKSATVFSKFEIKANFTSRFIYPSVIKSGVRLAPMTEWNYKVEGDSKYKGSLKYDSLSSKPLIIAGLNARCYDRDPPYRR